MSWHEGTSTRAPVIEHSVISPPTGGSLIVEAELPNTTTGIAGVTITATGPGTSTAVQTLTTDANGCAVFGGLTPGTYAIAETDPGYATSTGITSQSAIVVAGETQTLTFQLGQLGYRPRDLPDLHQRRDDPDSCQLGHILALPLHGNHLLGRHRRHLLITGVQRRDRLSDELQRLCRHLQRRRPQPDRQHELDRQLRLDHACRPDGNRAKRRHRERQPQR